MRTLRHSRGCRSAASNSAGSASSLRAIWGLNDLAAPNTILHGSLVCKAGRSWLRRLRRWAGKRLRQLRHEVREQGTQHLLRRGVQRLGRCDERLLLSQEERVQRPGRRAPQRATGRGALAPCGRPHSRPAERVLQQGAHGPRWALGASPVPGEVRADRRGIRQAAFQQPQSRQANRLAARRLPHSAVAGEQRAERSHESC
mmetsp:Transcript_16560/g.45519  ORF Transcript_16560/g.45519 Transcript_16560/m.45519 type:complete len:201 (-) Transcript_16560:15-617(-)